MPITSKMPMLLVVVLALAISAVGCGTTAPSRFYALSPMVEAAETPPSEIVLEVGPWTMPEYLKRPQIVTRSASAELELARFDRWAEPLEDSFGRVLIMNLGTLLNSSQVREFSSKLGPEADYWVGGRVYRFDVDESGLAVLDVQWSMRDADQQLAHGPMRSRYEEQSESKRSYDAGVQALSRAMARFSREIAAAARASSR